MWTNLNSSQISIAKHGYKAYALSRIIAHTDLCVPMGFVLGKPFTIDVIRETATQAMSVRDIVADLKKRCMRTRLLTYPLILRSSASIEDTQRRSCAGLFSSYPDIREDAGLRDAIGNMIVPVSEATFNAYNMKVTHYLLSLIAQQYIKCDVRFVAFTQDIVSGSNCYVAEVYQKSRNVALFQLNSDGQIQHVIYELRRGLAQKAIGNKGMALAHICRTLQDLFARDQDIELGIADDRLYVFQSRPITV